jgi:hypothetical protein
MGGEMLTKCSNPRCDTPFDYREGRLIRFSRYSPDAELAEDRYIIRHFWLCGSCTELYTFEYASGTNLTIKLRDRHLSEEHRFHVVAAA